jgi:hypothetical protein
LGDFLIKIKFCCFDTSLEFLQKNCFSLNTYWKITKQNAAKMERQKGKAPVQHVLNLNLAANS